MSVKQEPKDCIQKIGEFGAAIKEKECDNVASEKFRLIKELPFLSVYSNGEIEVKLRRLEGPDGPVDIDAFSVRPGGPSYDIVLTKDGYSVTAEPGFPMRSMRPKRIDKAVARLQEAKNGIRSIENLLRELFPDTPIADRP